MSDDTNLDGMVDAAGAPPLPGTPAAKPKPTAPAKKPTVQKKPVAINVASEELVIKPLQIDTPGSDAAIDDIVAQEADTVLAAQDAGIEAAADVAEAQVPEYNEPSRRQYPVFWFAVTLLVIIAIAALVMLMSPGLSPSFAP